jgi:adenylosuccinate synthase
MKAYIVIGSLFGDEGKGITTDYFCRKNPVGSIVVRFSGGHQAGHNVKIGDVSHVHSNYGSGALRGVPSYYSEHCTVYPVTLYNEREILLPKLPIGTPEPELYYHPLVRVTTPADVAYNRLTEQKLGHGSCGLGVAATMKRNEVSGYKLFGIDLLHPEILDEKIRGIYWYYRGLIQDTDINAFNTLFEKELPQFENAIKKLHFKIKPYSFLEYYYNLIFEGSQGILLDMNHGLFPHVTYANTTSKNALEICKSLNITNVEIYYVTRCYQTRHGAGWMSNRNPITLVNTEDEINKFNDWQKEFKIGEIDYDLLNHAYRIDNIYSEGIRKNLVVTCMDQRPKFKFDYDRLLLDFDVIYNSYSDDSKTFE